MLGKFPKNSARKIMHQMNISKATEFVNSFYKSSTKSIDLFLSRNPNLSNLGKFTILFSIFKAEKNSKFREELEDESKDWYFYLFNRMTDDFTSGNKYHIAENNIAFITFNHDRSLEHFLFESLKHSFTNIEERDIISEINKMKFIHIYGKVAKLNWQDNNGIEYKNGLYLNKAHELIDNVKIIYDESENPELEEAKN